MQYLLPLAIALLWPALSFAQKAPAAGEFERLEGCEYIAGNWNDGDSFRVRTADGVDRIFRLYFVDTPESEDSFPDRVKEQADYFGVTPARAMEIGKEAARFTQEQLGASFTAWTRWKDAMGRSKLQRVYVMVETQGGKDLGEELVANGLARIYGVRTPLPDGTDSRAYLERLAKLEAAAKAAKRGGWGSTSSSEIPKPDAFGDFFRRPVSP